MPPSLSRSIRLFATGFVMGVADLIPGVSGGTIAFLAGIYEELLFSIQSVTGPTLRLVFQGEIQAAIKSIPFSFLLPLALGLGTALFSLASLLSWLLHTHPLFVWAFFFGLVLASTVIVMRRIKHWQLSHKVAFVVATILAYLVVGAVPLSTPTNLPFIFLAGAIAICAMILPGISGSFILLLLGKYDYILAAVTERDFLTLTVFTAGCVLGLSFFARFLSWLFAHYHDMSVAVLAGVMLGSIRKIWPWQVAGKNTLPDSFDTSVVLALVLAIAAAALVYYLERLKLTKEYTDDVVGDVHTPPTQ